MTKLRGRLRDAVLRLRNPAVRILPDVGLSFLGVAGVFFVMSFPPTASFEFDLWQLGVSAFFFFAGLVLRASYGPSR